MSELYTRGKPFPNTPPIIVSQQIVIETGYELQTQRLAGRDRDVVFVRLLPDGASILVLTHPTTGTTLRLIPERTYSSSGPLRSLRFVQRPDIAIEISTPAETPRVILFDPKYKLDSDGKDSVGTPLKVDIDKMHTYRDAIRDHQDRHVVHSAHILYPSTTMLFGQNVGAIGADPKWRDEMRHEIGMCIRNGLLTSA